MREYMANIMVLGLSLAFLWHFSNIAGYGTHLICEPNKIILFSEIALLCSVCVFALVNIIEKLGR